MKSFNGRMRAEKRNFEIHFFVIILNDNSKEFKLPK